MNDKKQIFGWAMYDWANSAYVTTTVVAVLPAYFAAAIVPEEGFQIGGTMLSATSLWGYMISFSAFFVFLFAPFLGAIADFSGLKKKFLVAFCYGGSLFATLLYFCESGDVWLTIILFVLSQIGFVGGNIFYDSFLPQIASEDKMDWVSGKGFAYGYIGGGIQFAISLGLISMNESIGISAGEAARIAMAMSAIWWAGFSIFTFKYLKEEKTAEQLPKELKDKPKFIAFSIIGFKRVWLTTKKVKHFKHLLLYLIAFMIYNDGIQTVISMATIYGKQELGLDTTVLMVTLLIIQFVSIGGALLFGKIAGKIKTKFALMITLVLWSGVVVYAYFMTTAEEYFALGVIVGICMGGSQSLSRSFYGSMIPQKASAEFYGFYSVFNKFSAIWGPLVFALISQFTGSARLSIISLIVFFIVGLILLAFVDVEKAKEAKLSELF
ncbi:MAG: MFS transporter [Calditrichaeota bacterium]|nr:MAG: MFS transporter [Calditrichota bacterium]